MYIKQNLTIRTHTINHCKFIINHCKFITHTKNYFYNSTKTMAKVGLISCVLIVFLVFYSGLFNLSALIEFHIVMIFLPSFQFVTFSCKYLLTKELIETILINSFSDPKKLNLLKTLGGCTGNTNSLHLIHKCARIPLLGFTYFHQMNSGTYLLKYMDVLFYLILLKLWYYILYYDDHRKFKCKCCCVLQQ